MLKLLKSFLWQTLFFFNFCVIDKLKSTKNLQYQFKPYYFTNDSLNFFYFIKHTIF